MQPLPASALFTRAEARAAGWSDSKLTRAVRLGRVRRLRRDLFMTAAHDPDVVTAAVAAARSCSGSVVSHRSAAILHGLPVLYEPRLPELTVHQRGTGDTAHARLHRARIDADETTVIDGVPVTTIARTIVDVARAGGHEAGLVTLDAALHQQRVSLAAIDFVITSCRRWPGVGAARGVRALADANAESPLESVSRFAIHQAQLPTPQSQVVIRNAWNGFIARVDFYWDELGVVGEADGRVKYDSRDILLAEKVRQEALETLGLVVVRWGWADVRQGRLPARISAGFRRAQRLSTSALPRQWSISGVQSGH